MKMHVQVTKYKEGIPSDGEEMGEAEQEGGKSSKCVSLKLCRSYLWLDPAETLEPNVCLRIFPSQDKMTVI